MANIIGTPLADTLSAVMYGNSDDFLAGRGKKDVLYGWNGDDVLDGGNGKDILFGERDHDTLLGGNGDDSLDGGSGDDILVGGNGQDTLKGGRNLDNFVFSAVSHSPNGSPDTITSFNAGIGEIIDVSGITGGNGGYLPFMAGQTNAQLVGGNQFQLDANASGALDVGDLVVNINNVVGIFAAANVIF